MKLPLDAYSFRARFLPALLVLAPAVAATAAWIPLDSPAWKTVVSIGTLAAASVLLAHLSRDLGRRKQDQLFKRWGGPPTTRFLRHRDTTINPATRQRYLTKLATLIPGIELPSSRSERARPDAADSVYASCADWLREQTRDRDKFGLLFDENVGYGFRRNTWAMKPAGMFVAGVALLAATSRLAWELQSVSRPSVECIAAIVVSAPMFVWWILRIRPGWVAQAAEAYAKTLLATCEQL